MSSIEGTGNAGDRVTELELVLRNLLECFEYGIDGATVETVDGGIVALTPDVEEAISQAMLVLEEG